MSPTGTVDEAVEGDAAADAAAAADADYVEAAQPADQEHATVGLEEKLRLDGAAPEADPQSRFNAMTLDEKFALYARDFFPRV